MSRPPSPPEARKRWAVRFNDAEYAAVVAAARRRGLSAAEAVRVAVRAWLSAAEPDSRADKKSNGGAR